MVLLYMVTWIPSIYPLYVSIYTSTMDPSWDIYSIYLGVEYPVCFSLRGIQDPPYQLKLQ